MSVQLGSCLPNLPILGSLIPQVRSGPVVWAGSTQKEIRWKPFSKREASEIYRAAEDFDRQTHQKGRHGGALGHSGLAVLRSLLFHFPDYLTGRLDPSLATIAKRINRNPRTVSRALVILREHGVVIWARRCVQDPNDGRLRQISNAYSINPQIEWKGYKPKIIAPPPEPETWGSVIHEEIKREPTELEKSLARFEQFFHRIDTESKNPNLSLSFLSKSRFDVDHRLQRGHPMSG